MAEATSLDIKNRSPPNKATQRQAMYKVSTPPWKETYRKKCFERLRKNREKLLSKLRHIESSEKEIDLGNDFIKDIMSREWRSLWDDETEMTKIADLPLNISFIPPEENENIDRLIKIFEDLEEELKLEELRMLEEFENYEEELLLEEKSLCEAFEALSANEVICPICKISPLHENKGVIFCKCGIRINTEQDALSLTNVKQMLEDGLELHNYTCHSEPEFSTLCVLGTTNLFMTCKDCDMMHVII